MAARKKPIKSSTKGVAHELALAKLLTSGLSEADMQLLRMDALEAEDVAKLHPGFKSIPALRISYWDPTDLNKPLSCQPKWPPFYRLRYLRADGDKKDDVRYTNEPGAGVVAYFPPCVDWPDIIQDPNATLIITEGELKAAKATIEGYPAIGLGGVWNFRSSQLGISFLHELECINWVKRRVYIIYDSDVITKSGVQDALNSMAEELANRGALPFIVFVPEGDNQAKQGLDDWCVANPGVDLYELCQRHQPLTQARKLWALNEELIYIRDTGIIINQQDGTKMATSQFKESYANVDYAELVVTDSGSVSLKKAPIATSWMKWPQRHQVNTMTYWPGAAKIIVKDGRSMYNLWPGWGCEPKPGDISPFIELVDHLFQGCDPLDREWFLDWCAYPLQYPGTKLFTAVVIHGIKHGTGKSLLGYTLGRIYGKNFTEINQSHLHAGFNAWAEGKQLVMGDDVTGSNKRQDNDLLKKMITQKELRVNTKFMPEYTVPDYIAYLFTSNHPDSFFLENDDRRLFIHEVLGGPLDEGFYMDYGLWLDTTGPSALFDWLLKRDVSGFNPSAPARRTVAKEQMTADTKSDLGTWVEKLRLDPDQVLRVGDIVVEGDLFTTGELLELYDPQGTKRTTANGLGRELRRASVPRAHGGIPIRGPKGTDRYYIVRNPERWINADHHALSAQLIKQAGGSKARKY